LIRLALLAVMVAGSALAQDIRLEGQLTQGGLMVGQAPPGSRVTFDGKPLRLAKDGRFVFGFGRDHAAEAVLSLRLPDGRTEERRLEIARRDYQIQRIDGLPPRTVTPSPEDLKRIERDRALIGQAFARDSASTGSTPGFAGNFAWPALGPISGVYGSQRILNGEPRQPHFGVDVASPTGTPVAAAADATVALAEPDMFYTGGTVILDHGHGLSTLYAHLSAVEVKAGQVLRQGEQIGRIGATGRVTGPHLHWGANWFGVKLDPSLLVPPMPKS
jgi:murein DD-endopeptidase MepM/ murein hydrolase activator NlpD